jgi:putative mRNA 3-end processing factor
MKIRYGPNCAGSFQSIPYGQPLKIDELSVTLFPAGHILGSAQILLEYGSSRTVITGDYKVRSDHICAPFEIVPCDLLITEATFGLPVFQHPEASQEIQKLLTSVKEQTGRCHVIGAYSLGKAQRVIKLLRDAGYDAPIYLHGALIKLCHFYQEQGIDLGDLRAVAKLDKETFRGQIILAPPSALKDVWSRRLPDPLICMASGWMSVKQRAKQSLVELPLIISDHADWNELTWTVENTGAEEVWVTHGREEGLVHWCQNHGLKAAPLSLQGREETED